MTKSQHKVYNRLRKKQVNRDIGVMDVNDRAVTFFVPFPGLYCTYGARGELLSAETVAERIAGGRSLYDAKQLTLGGEMGSSLPFNKETQ